MHNNTDVHAPYPRELKTASFAPSPETRIEFLVDKRGVRIVARTCACSTIRGAVPKTQGVFNVFIFDSLRYDHYFVVPVWVSKIVHVQVTGSLLQCMSEPEDVLEYVDGKIMKSLVQRLLKWLERVGGGQAQKITVLEVEYSDSLPAFLFSQHSHGWL